MASQSFSRQELYDLVWSDPMIKLAARYGISGNGLAKACRRANIPVPERGYWARKQAGQKIKQPPLPAPEAGMPGRVIIEPPSKRLPPPEPPPVPPTVQEKVDAEQRSAKPIVVPATLSSPHRIISGWLQEDRRQRQQRRHDPWLRDNHKPIDQTDLDKRRLRILSALFKAIEARDYELTADDSRYVNAAYIAQENERLSIGIHERIRQVRRQLTDADRAKRLYISPGQKWTQEKVPTGELVLTVAEPDRYGSKQWSDGPVGLLEEKLGEVLPYVAGVFEQIRLRREREAEERARQWKIAEERQRQEMERKRETVRYRRLMAHCENWRIADDIRAFVAAVAASQAAAANADSFADWKSWALGHADRIDPLKGANVLDRSVSDYEAYSVRE